MTGTRENALEVLDPGDARHVSAAADILAARPGQDLDVPRLLARADGIRYLVDLLTGSAGLRRVVSARLGSQDGGHAVCLCAADEKTVDLAVQRVRAALKRARRDGRRENRVDRRGSLEERRQDREEDKLRVLRDARDRARAQVEMLTTDNRRLNLELAELRDALTAAEGQLDAAQAMLDDRRAFKSDVPALAAALSEAMTRGMAADSDPRGIGPGEPARVRPGYPDSPVSQPENLVEVVRQAARRVGTLTESAIETAESWLPQVLRAISAPAPVARTREVDLRVEVLGGGDEIGGSCVLITAAGTRILVDAGSLPGETPLGPPRLDRALSGRLDAVVITHAHLDHSGWVPAITAKYPHLAVLATEATGALLDIMWQDSARVMARRAANGDDECAVPYTRDDVRTATNRVRRVSFGQVIPVGELTIELFPAGHIVGAAGVVVTAGPNRVVVSGDVSGPGQYSVGGWALAESARGADLLLLESTYAGAGRALPRRAAVNDFVRDASTILDRGGRVLVPAFALGRAQEVALICAEHMPGVPVLIDGLAREVSRAYERYGDVNGGSIRIFGDSVREVPPGGTLAEIDRFHHGVIIATSGMLNGGPAVRWAGALLPDRSAGVMVVGYQDEDSPGARLLKLADDPRGTFSLPAEDGSMMEIPVAAHVMRYGLGAHASADELVSIANEVAAREVMLVHGERRGQQRFRDRLNLRGQPTALASAGWSPGAEHYGRSEVAPARGASGS